MKIFKKLICLVMILVVSLSFFGCDDENGETKVLSTPQNVTVNDAGQISWNAVENAEYYIVVINGSNLKSDTTTYTVGSTVNDFTYSVIAAAEGYLSSAPSETKTFKGKGIPVVVDPVLDSIKVSVSGKQLVGSGKQTKLTASVNYPNGNFNRNVVWSITEGGQYATIDANGNFKAKEVTEDIDVTVRATSVDNDKKYGELVVCVACEPQLTDEMLDAVKDDYIGFEGFMDIDLYTFELYEKFVRSVQVAGISAQMNGERWHARYVDGNTGYTTDIHYKKEEGIARQVALSLTNDEEYYPMTDDAGNPVSWEDAGLYNNFKSLKASDFTFDEEDWRFYYNGNDSELLQKMTSSASPYDFVCDRFGLIVDGGEVLGIYAVSKPDYSVVQGYKAIEKLYSYINCGSDNVTIPLITKFEHNPKTTDGGNIDHDSLDTAIANMQALKSYKLDFTLSSHMATGYTVGGFVETVTDGDYFFEPYDMIISGGKEIKTPIADSGYGYHRIDGETYNSYNYDAETGKNVAARAYKGDMNNAKASFAFASEIFTAWQKATVNNAEAYIYYVDETMCDVASTFYFGVGNDMPLYGLFAMKYDYLADYTPYVVIQNGYIIEAGFFYFLGEMYGEVRVHYLDFDTAELPETFVSFEGYVPRTPPVGWNELTVIDETYGSDSNEINAKEYFAKLFGSEEAVDDLPFFGELLGDSFGFALATYRKPGGVSYSTETVILYYDVPLESDRTINATIKSAQEFLIKKGFVKNSYGEYVKGNVSALPYDNSLDFWIYVWKTV